VITSDEDDTDCDSDARTLTCTFHEERGTADVGEERFR